VTAASSFGCLKIESVIGVRRASHASDHLAPRAGEVEAGEGAIRESERVETAQELSMRGFRVTSLATSPCNLGDRCAVAVVVKPAVAID